SASPVFSVDANGWSNGSGKVCFVDAADNASNNRQITTTLGDSYDRSTSYIAFPEVEIATATAKVYLPANMGMDAKKVTRTKSGALQIQATATDRASLRITGADAVSGSAVIVEHHDGGISAGYLYPFASPYTALKSVYFAGNWVRKMDFASDKHVEYVYANENENGFILKKHYVKDANETFVGGNPYFIKTPSDYNHTSGYQLTADVSVGEYSKDLYVFNGTPFTGVSAGDGGNLYTASTLFTSAPSNSGTTRNWVIGNSYTAPLDVEKLVDALESAQNIKFAKQLYYYFPGQTTWSLFSIDDTATPQVVDLSEIPSQAIFMVRVSNKNTSTDNFSLGKDLQTHTSNVLPTKKPSAANPKALASTSSYSDLLLTVSPEASGFIHDKTVIGLREGSSLSVDELDMAKVENNSDGVFRLYTKAQSGESLLSNAVPFETANVRLSFHPGSQTQSYTLEASRIESMNTEALLLHDEQTNQWIDLRSQDSYTFVSSPEDNPDRFMVYFKEVDTQKLSDLYGYYHNGELHIKMLQESDKDSRLYLYDMKGMLIKEDIITNYPSYTTAADLIPGVYVVRIEGTRKVSLKFAF
ncbi:hypothetical protein D0T49_12910, partial [Paludibacter sp. 221]|uniref:hypothetical protein n=1 Tax=Paludibacter sp. 221 TaxID=2302939 RepID=UPI0013D1CD26